MMNRAAPIVLALVLLAACRGEETPAPETQRIDLEEARPNHADAQASPDTSAARWSVAEDGQAVSFGNAGAAPLLSLECDRAANPRTLTIIRHAAALPGEGALFPVMGNGMTSRFLVDAALGAEGWRWQGALPAEDPLWDVFTGPRDIEATLPGRGMLEIAGDRVPGEFVEWCRADDPGAPVEPTPAPTPEEGLEIADD